MILRALLRSTPLRRLTALAALSLFTIFAAVLLPCAIVLGGIGALRPHGRGRLARIGVFTAVYLAAELTGLLQVAALWGRYRRRAASDDGNRAAFEDRHYALLNRLLGRLYATARRCFDVRILPPDQEEPALPRGPLLVFSRHAGPGDSFLLVHALLAAARRRPHVVLKQTLSLDPLIDVVFHRTTNCFVGPGELDRARVPARISQLAARLGPDDALLLFPEGGNFTQARRTRLIARLRQLRDWSLLPTAQVLEHVLPPHSSGVFAAIDAAPPGTTAVFVAHTGLDRLESLGEIWRAIPLSEPLAVTWWTVPIEQVPCSAGAREQWLTAQWARIDEWIDDRNRVPAPERLGDRPTAAA